MTRDAIIQKKKNIILNSDNNIDNHELKKKKNKKLHGSSLNKESKNEQYSISGLY